MVGSSVFMRFYSFYYVFGVISSIPLCSSQSRPRLLDVMLDLAVVVQPVWTNEAADHVRNIIQHLPDRFELGPERMRIAIVSAFQKDNTTVEIYVSNLIDSIQDFATAVKSIQSTDRDKKIPADEMLKVVRDQILIDDTRFSAVVLINCWQGFENAVDEAWEIRTKKAFVMFFVFAETDNQVVIGNLKNISNGMIHFALRGGLTYNRLHLDEVKKTFDELLCKKSIDSGCFFTDTLQSGCAQGWWTPSIPLKYGDCTRITQMPPPTGATCPREECVKLCDEKWPWPAAVPTCSECGMEINTTILREGQAEWPPLANCPRVFECPGCTSSVAAITADTSAEIKATPKPASELPEWLIAVLVVLAIGIVVVLIIILSIVCRWRKRGRAKMRWMPKKEAAPDVDSGRDSQSDKSAVNLSGVMNTSSSNPYENVGPPVESTRPAACRVKRNR